MLTPTPTAATQPVGRILHSTLLSTVDALRLRWLAAIKELGADAAAEDAAQAFVLRLGCTPSEGRAIVLRAWHTLGLLSTNGSLRDRRD